MTRRQNRMILVLLLVLGVFLAGYLGIKAFSENLLYFYTPTDIESGKTPIGKSFRVGGLVVPGSVVHEGINVTFLVTDNNEAIKVSHDKVLPDLFSEGQAIVATGSMSDENFFLANEVLAKHDENYMPPEVAEALQNSSIKE